MPRRAPGEGAFNALSAAAAGRVCRPGWKGAGPEVRLMGPPFSPNKPVFSRAHADTHTRRHADTQTCSATQLHTQAPHGEHGSRCFIDGFPPPPCGRCLRRTRCSINMFHEREDEDVDGWMTETCPTPCSALFERVCYTFACSQVHGLPAFISEFHKHIPCLPRPPWGVPACPGPLGVSPAWCGWALVSVQSWLSE